MSSLYKKDFYAWGISVRDALIDKDWDRVDLKNLIDEVDGLVRGETSKVVSAMRLIFSHLLKWIYQPEKRSGSWISTIERERDNLEDLFEDNPSIVAEQEILSKLAYKRARKEATRETRLPLKLFPEEMPFSLEDALKKDWLP